MADQLSIRALSSVAGQEHLNHTRSRLDPKLAAHVGEIKSRICLLKMRTL